MSEKEQLIEAVLCARKPRKCLSMDEEGPCCVVAQYLSIRGEDPSKASRCVVSEITIAARLGRIWDGWKEWDIIDISEPVQLENDLNEDEARMAMLLEIEAHFES